jgi:hypothetical protein
MCLIQAEAGESVAVTMPWIGLKMWLSTLLARLMNAIGRGLEDARRPYCAKTVTQTIS